MKTFKKKYMTPSEILGKAMALLLVIALFGCNKDDGADFDPVGPIEEQTIFGKWRTDQTVFQDENAKYIVVNDDYSIDILSEDNLGFKRITKRLKVVSEDEITVTSSLAEEENYDYSINGQQLSIVNQESGTETLLTRDKNGPSTNTWIKTLTIVHQQDAPWNRNVDIGFNGTMILFPNGAEDQNIALINPLTLGMEGILETDINSYPVEAEKSTGNDQLYFQADSRSAILTAYHAPGNETNYAFHSEQLGETNEFGFAGTATIRGLAATEDKTIWASNQYERNLYLYDYNGTGRIIDQVALNIPPHGLDFQDGYLYVSDGKLLHKCQTTSGFRAVESYKIPGHLIYGVAYDGEHFILNTQKLPEDDGAIILVGSETDNKLMKVDLSL